MGYYRHGCVSNNQPGDFTQAFSCRQGNRLIWNLVLLGLVLFFLVCVVAGVFVYPLAEADNLVLQLAPHTQVSEGALREALVSTLFEWRERHLVFDALPWCVLAAVMAVRIYLERRRTGEEKKR